MAGGRDGDAVTAARVPHRPGIDGLRALAVVAVVLYHADVSWLPGGFLGVDVFFVISGYLICSLLVAEWESTAETGRAGLDLAGFWIRRARRLLPALAAAVVGTAVVASVVAPDAAQRLGQDAGGVLLYVSNWWQLARGESYVQAFGRPSPVQHLWSLAVEEQFYLVFPLLMAVVLPRFGRRPRVLAGLAALLGAASAVWMAVLWQPGVDPTRVWFGTDTRATGLCFGVALAFLLDPGRLPRLFPDRRSIVLLDLAGAYGLLALGGLMVGIGELDPALFRGGFAACALASGAVVIAAAHPGTHVAWALSRRPLQWAGTRSYAIYLWHWPVVVMTRPGLDVPWHGNAVLALRVGLTAVLAELSWRLVEQPVRTGQLAAWWRARRPFARIRLVSGGALVASVLIAVVAAAPAEAPPATLAAALARPAVPVRLASDVAPAATTTTTTVLVTTTTVVPAPRAPSPTSVLSVSELVSAPTASPTTTTLAPAPPPAAAPAPAEPARRARATAGPGHRRLGARGLVEGAARRERGAGGDRRRRRPPDLGGPRAARALPRHRTARRAHRLRVGARDERPAVGPRGGAGRPAHRRDPGGRGGHGAGAEAMGGGVQHLRAAGAGAVPPHAARRLALGHRPARGPERRRGASHARGRPALRPPDPRSTSRGDGEHGADHVGTVSRHVSNDRLCILTVHAHPDDESSKGAGTIARYAAEGVRTVLVCCTGGEAGDILNELADSEEARTDLAAVRSRELDAAVEVIGYHRLHKLGYRDSGMPESEANADPSSFHQADLDEATGRLVAIIREERPQVIVTYDWDHGRGHPDHIRVHEISHLAFERAGDPAWYPEAGDVWTPSKLYYTGVFTRGRVETLHAWFEERGEESPYLRWIERFSQQAEDGRPAPKATTARVDVGDFLHVTPDALAAHATQVPPTAAWFRVPQEVLRELYPWEDYTLAASRVPTPTDELETDLFAGLR